MNSMNTPDEIISKATLFRYGILAFPLAFASMPLYIHATDFYATEFEVSLVTLGMILLALRLFDAIQDPLIGYFSDRYSEYRLPGMLFSMLLLTIGFFMLFNPDRNYLLFWFGSSMLIATTAFSLLTINLNTLGAVWSKDYHQKTRISAWREAIGLSGLLIASSLPGILQLYETKQTAFYHYSIILVIVAVLTSLVFSYWYLRDRSTAFQAQANNNDTSTKHSFLSRFKYNRRFFLIYAVSMFASAIPAVLVLFFIRDRLGAENYSGLFLFVYFVSGIIGMPIWQRLSRNKDKMISWISAMLLGVISFLWAYSLGENDLVAYGIVCVFSGLALGAELVLPPSILADLIEKQQLSHQASLQFSMLAFLSKFSFAVASGTMLWLLGLSSFQPNQHNTADALHMLSFYYALVPCAIKLFAAYLLWRWMKTTKHDHHEFKTYSANSFSTLS